jgi:hypothetical protein
MLVDADEHRHVIGQRRQPPAVLARSRQMCERARGRQNQMPRQQVIVRTADVSGWNVKAVRDFRPSLAPAASTECLALVVHANTIGIERPAPTARVGHLWTWCRTRPAAHSNWSKGAA